MRSGEAAKSGDNGGPDAAELYKGFGVAMYRGLDLSDSVFQLYTMAGDVYDIIRQGSNPAVLSGEVVVVGVAKVGQTGLEGPTSDLGSVATMVRAYSVSSSILATWSVRMWRKELYGSFKVAN